MKANSSVVSGEEVSAPEPAVNVSLPRVRLTHSAAPPHAHTLMLIKHTHILKRKIGHCSDNYIRTYILLQGKFASEYTTKTWYEICTVSFEYTKKDIQEI